MPPMLKVAQIKKPKNIQHNSHSPKKKEKIVKTKYRELRKNIKVIQQFLDKKETLNNRTVKSLPKIDLCPQDFNMTL